MSILLLQPSFFMLKTKSYAQIPIGFRWLLIAISTHSSIRITPSDSQQGENYRIINVYVPAARMSIPIDIVEAINNFSFSLIKYPLFPRSPGISTEIGAFSTLFTLVTGGFRGKPMWGIFQVWDDHLTFVFISFLIYSSALHF
eukprot:Gb_23663 [translate_table: standard]